jgi:hypothetical protein
MSSEGIRGFPSYISEVKAVEKVASIIGLSQSKGLASTSRCQDGHCWQDFGEHTDQKQWMTGWWTVHSLLLEGFVFISPKE